MGHHAVEKLAAEGRLVGVYVSFDEAERDRQDPERLRLRMSDPHDPASVLAVMRRLDEVRGQFLTTRPDPDC